MSQLINDRELATILAALRLWQRKGCPDSEHFDDVEPLDEDEVDELCERLNTSDEIGWAEVVEATT